MNDGIQMGKIRCGFHFEKTGFGSSFHMVLVAGEGHDRMTGGDELRDGCTSDETRGASKTNFHTKGRG